MLISFEIPFLIELSKNKKYLFRSSKFLNPNYKKAKELVGLALLRVFPKDVKIEKKKVYIKIYVYKPDNRSDVINLIEGIADGIKGPLGIDDRYFSLSIDWEVSNDPKILINIEV